MSLPRKILVKRLRRFVEEDVGHGDVTTFYTVPRGTIAEAEVIAKDKGVIAGVEEAAVLAESFGLRAEVLSEDGEVVTEKKKIMRITGDASTLLSIERTLLNLLSRMSGIATVTSGLVGKIREAGYRTRIAATRKTAPGLSYFDKKAVVIGGGDAHRWGLDDMVLIKDNHVVVAEGIKQAIQRVRGKASFSMKIEVEVQDLNDLLETAKAGVDIIMLDNFTPKQTKEAVESLKKARLRDRVLIEVSGGITEHNLLDYASADVDVISLGEITHSAKALDISLEITKVTKPS